MDSDSTFHPASQLNLAFALPMTPMCVKSYLQRYLREPCRSCVIYWELLLLF